MCREVEEQKINSEHGASAERDPSKKTPSSERVRKMRNWLFVKNSSSMGGFLDESEAPLYGDGHSGWNR